MDRKAQRLVVAGVVAVMALAHVGCGSSIGDGCSDNVDCSTSGLRICDRSQQGGYCTIAGCTPTSCPDEAVCVEFYATSFLSKPCDPATEDAVDPALQATDDCASDEFCLSSGLCALRTLGRRFCMRKCGGDGDCRDEYECRATGTFGAEAVLDPEAPEERSARFCAQKPEA